MTTTLGTAARAAVAAVAIGIGGAAVASCVPEGPPTGDAPMSTVKPPATGSPVRAKPGEPAASPGPPITAPFEDRFDRAELGPDWNALSPHWRIQQGRLCARGARNRGVWLLRRLPVNARIELDAFSESPEGDLKVEVWGDGRSGATSTSYTNATSYLAILGGWKNSRHVLARLDEHGDDRLEIAVDPASDDERARPVEPGQPYRFTIQRADGKTIEWLVNGVVYHELADPEPLAGAGHEHFGFNDWDAPVCFDNLRITPL